jgi:putative transposase
MRRMRLEEIDPKPRLSGRGEERRIYPYLLRNVEILRPNHVWSSDITYVPLAGGYALRERSLQGQQTERAIQR